MKKQTQVNPYLKEIIATAINQATPPTSEPEPPRIVVYGDGNVFAPGGTVHVRQAFDGPRGKRE